MNSQEVFENYIKVISSISHNPNFKTKEEIFGAARYLLQEAYKIAFKPKPKVDEQTVKVAEETNTTIACGVINEYSLKLTLCGIFEQVKQEKDKTWVAQSTIEARFRKYVQCDKEKSNELFRYCLDMGWLKKESEHTYSIQIKA